MDRIDLEGSKAQVVVSTKTQSGGWPDGRPSAGLGDRWQPGRYTRDELAAALLLGRVAGEDCSHDRSNVVWKMRRLAGGDPKLQFGIDGLPAAGSWQDALRWMGEAAGFDPDPSVTSGPVRIDPWRMLDALEEAGDRLALAAVRGERVLLATGHPSGLIQLYMAVGELLTGGGATLLRPLEGHSWEEEDGHHRRVRYLRGVAFLTWGGSAMHTHSARPMERMLAEVRPDLVFADHGFAGAAIQAGIDTISIVDVNDPAPVVARQQGWTRTVIVMDDNVEPDDYWPCFQAIAGRTPNQEGPG